MKKLTCRNIGVDCDVVFIAETDDEIMLKAREHAMSEHNLPQIPPSIESKCRAAICEVKEGTEHECREDHKEAA